MRPSLPTTAAFLWMIFLPQGLIEAQDSPCEPNSLSFSETMALSVEKVGSVPAINTGAWTYNMQPMDNFDGDLLFFLDQKNGFIYSYDAATSEVKTVLNTGSPTSEVPDGLTLDWDFALASSTYRVKAMTQGPSKDEVVIVFTSSTLPTGWDVADATLPPPGPYGQWVCDSSSQLVWVPDLYRMGTTPACFQTGGNVDTFTAYDVFVKYTFADGELENPVPFFVSEVNVIPGHLGGGIATIDQGILWSPSDCLTFGLDGSFAPQLDHEHCGKILLIDPSEEGRFEIVAKGVRNSQQMRVVSTKKQKSQKTKKAAKEELLVFMDIGGVTAEEVNAVSIRKLVKSSEIVNFGWGRSLDDGKAREGTFYVNPGQAGVLGVEPQCVENAPIGEPGYTQPWIQFGRTPTDSFYAISSIAVPSAGVNKIKLLWSEMNTGHVLGTDEDFVKGAPPVTGYKLKLYDNQGNHLENGFNDLVKQELGDVGYYRGDPRLFHFPDGTAGVFIERTGAFYKLSETRPL